MLHLTEWHSLCDRHVKVVRCKLFGLLQEGTVECQRGRRVRHAEPRERTARAGLPGGAL